MQPKSHRLARTVGAARLARRICLRLGLAVVLLVSSAGRLQAENAAPPEMVFKRLGGADGLSQGAVMAVQQDSQGFMWFGTEDGLDRYDGYELRHFIHKPGDPSALPNNWVSALTRDSSGTLWIGTDGGGLRWHDGAAGRFSPVGRAGRPPLVDDTSNIRSLFEDAQHRLWVATRNMGLQVIDAGRRSSRTFRHDAGDPASLSDDSVFAVAQDTGGCIWVGTAAGLDKIDPQSGRMEAFGQRLVPQGRTPASGSKVTALHADRHGDLWIGLEHGLASLEISTGAVTLYTHRDGDAESLPEGRVTALLEDDTGRFWIGTSAGLALMDRHSGRFVSVRHDPTNPASLPDSSITSLFQDRSGLLWVGTKAGGVARWNPRSWSFGHRRFGADAADNITSFTVDSHGAVWVGSFGAGVVSIDPANGAQRRFRRDSALPLHDDVVMALVADDRDRIWVGTMNGGIDRLDVAGHVVKHFGSTPGNPDTLPAPGIMSLLRDSRARIWVGTYGGGIAMIDPRSDRVLRYEHGRKDSSGLSSDRATALAEDGQGLIWVGTDGGGLEVLDPTSGRFAHFAHDVNDVHSLSSDTVYALHVDAAGTVWVGTRGGGLNRVSGSPFSASPLSFENLSEAEGLPNSTVYGIEADSKGTLWISTNRGIAALNPRDRSVRNFRRDHGLQADEFNFGAHYRGPDGTLYFGGSNGYNAFRAEGLQLNDTSPPVVLTGVLKLNSHATPLPETLSRLDLGYRDAVVTFQFAALDFTGPSENRYAYRLDGFDNDWVQAGNARQATYTHLDGGDYVFRVRAANNDGRWTETPLSLEMHVAPPPWATWWARTLYGIFAFSVVFLTWLAQHRRVQREIAYARRLQLEVEARTAELAERNRDMERANRQLRQVSVSDSLTGLGNRRRLHDEMDSLRRTQPGDATRPFVLMVVDLDHLKPINDQFGHEGGDSVLLQIAEILSREIRADDLIVRWGGDEFVVLCRDADLQTAAALAERVRSRVAKQIFRVGNGQVARTSCSIGFAAAPFCPDHPELLDWQQVLSIADLALYHAKRDRNTWIGWSATAAAAQLPSIVAALGADAAAMERDGFLIVQRRAWNPEETVDQLRAARSPGAL
jgi:diguanylate cyclase (GGDEF)-like protein